MQKIVVISDLEHSSPRISNILYFLNQNKYEKYWIGANPEHFVNKKDLPNGFEKKIKNLFFEYLNTRSVCLYYFEICS